VVEACHVIKKDCSRVTVTEFEKADRRTDQGTSTSDMVWVTWLIAIRRYGVKDFDDIVSLIHSLWIIAH